MVGCRVLSHFRLSRDDGPLGLVRKQVGPVHVIASGPSGSRDVAQASGGQGQAGRPIREGTNDPRARLDLSHGALQWVVVPRLDPMTVGEAVVGQRLMTVLFEQLGRAGGRALEYRMYLKDFGQTSIDNYWQSGGQRGFTGEKVYVVQTAPDVVQRAIVMTTDPGDLVLDPTCGSGTTAFVAEHRGRRWITIDTSRVALTLARARIVGTCYPYFLLRDTEAG